MSLLAEELVEEWLNRQGYFTIRGIRLGVHEMDLLAIRTTSGGIECRHIEVQASVNPKSYITKVPKDIQKETGRSPGSAKSRNEEELRQGVREWIQKKFFLAEKQKMLQQLVPSSWSRELVIHKVHEPREIEFFRDEGIIVKKLADIVADMKNTKSLIGGASGAHLVDLINITDD